MLARPPVEMIAAPVVALREIHQLPANARRPGVARQFSRRSLRRRSRPGSSQKRYTLRAGIVTQRAAFSPRRQIWRRSALEWVEELAKVPASEKAECRRLDARRRAAMELNADFSQRVVVHAARLSWVPFANGWG